MLEEEPCARVHREEGTGETILTAMGDAHVDVLVERLKRKFGASVKTGSPARPLPRDDPQAGQDRQSLQAADRRPWPVRPRGHRVRAAAIGIAASSSATRSWAAWCRSSTSPPSRRGCARRWPRECWPGIRWSTCAPAWSTAATTPLTARRWPSRSPPARRSSAPSPRPTRPSLSRSSRSRWSSPTSTWATSWGRSPRKRGHVLGMDSADGMQHLRAQVPQAEMFHYATELRSITQGRGRFSWKLDHYAEVPQHHRRQGDRRASGQGGCRRKALGRTARRGRVRRGGAPPLPGCACRDEAPATGRAAGPPQRVQSPRRSPAGC